LAALMQMIEDVEENVLRFLFACEELHIVNDQHVHHLIELLEVSHGVVLHSFNELLRELLCGNIENGLLRVVALDLDADGMGEVGLAQAYTTIDQQRVECSATRLLRYGETGAPCQAIAIALDEVLKGIVRVQVALYLDLA